MRLWTPRSEQTQTRKRANDSTRLCSVYSEGLAPSWSSSISEECGRPGKQWRTGKVSEEEPGEGTALEASSTAVGVSGRRWGRRTRLTVRSSVLWCWRGRARSSCRCTVSPGLAGQTDSAESSGQRNTKQLAGGRGGGGLTSVATFLRGTRTFQMSDFLVKNLWAINRVIETFIPFLSAVSIQ